MKKEINKTRTFFIMFAMLGLLTCMFIALDDSTTVQAGDVYTTSGSPANSTTYYVSDNVTITVTLTTKTGAAGLYHNFTTNVSGTWTTVDTADLTANGSISSYVTGMTTYGKKYFWASNTTNSNATQEWDNNTYFFYTRGYDAPPGTGSGTSGSTNRCSFIVKSADGSPLAGISILINDKTYTTNPAGQAVFNLPDGDYKWTATGSEGVETGILTVQGGEVAQMVTLGTTTSGGTSGGDVGDVGDPSTWSLDLNSESEIIAFVIVLAVGVFLFWKKMLWPLNMRSIVFWIVLIAVLLSILIV